MRGSAPASWGTTGGDEGVNGGAVIAFGAVLAAGGAGAYALVARNRRRKAQEEREALDKLRVVVDEDITAFGEELDRLDFHPSEKGANDAMRADYERALDSYDKAKSLMGAARHPSDVRGVTEALEDGRFSLAALDARRTDRPIPERRAPCFFDPRHGPSVTDMTWTPDGGQAREIPVCAVDASRLKGGLDPMARTVETGTAGGRTGRQGRRTAPGPAATSAAASSPACWPAHCSAACSRRLRTRRTTAAPTTAAATTRAPTSARRTSAAAGTSGVAEASVAAGTSGAGSRTWRVPEPGRVCAPGHGSGPAATARGQRSARPAVGTAGRARSGCRGDVPDQAADLIAEMSKFSFTLSLTITPPVSSAAFQVRPQSERRISAVPSKPTRSLP